MAAWWPQSHRNAHASVIEPLIYLCGSFLAMPESTTGARSGNLATSDRLPRIAWTVFRHVEGNRSLRFSSLETLFCVILSCLAKRT